MRHRVKKRKMSRPLGQRKALRKALLKALIVEERIKTTLVKAKFLKPHIDKMITLAKKNTLAARRQAFEELGSHSLVKKLFDKIGPRFANKQGSSCRIYRVGQRTGDGATLALIELTEKSPEKILLKRKAKSKKPEAKAEQVQDEPQKDKEKRASGLKKIFKKKKKI